MPTSIISGTVVDPSGTPQANTTVRARLVPKGATRISDNSSITEVESTTTDGSGNWSLTLEEQTNISPTGSYYAVEEVLSSGSFNQYAIQVPAENSNVNTVKVEYVNPSSPLIGFTGPQGPEGPQGDEGDVGPQGPAGADGTDGEAAVITHEAAGNPHGGYILKSLVDAAGDLLVGTADNTVGRIAKGAALQVIRVKADESTLEYADPAGGGVDIPQQDEPPGSPSVDDLWIDTNAPVFPYDLLLEYYGENALNDEFDNGVLDAAWVRSDSVGEDTHLVWTEAAGVLSADHTGTDSAAEMHGLVKPMGAFAIGKSIQTCVRHTGPSQASPMAGIVICDGTARGAGTQVIGAYWQGGVTANQCGIRRITNWVTDSGSVDVAMGAASWGLPMHLRLKWVAANSFQFSYSADGVSWIEQAAQAYTVTPTYIGLFITSWAAAAEFIYTFEYFRVV